MLAVSHRSFEALSTLHAGLDMEDSGTINPAALNAPNATSTSNLLTTASPRGQKRSRTPDSYGTPGVKQEGDDAKTNKIRKLKSEQSPAPSPNMSMAVGHQPVQTPHMRTSSLSHASPTQASPTRSTPGSISKPPVVKALPTVRDHTTDQLGPEGDEYIPREIDEAGETKVSKDGYPLGERKYRCRTFNVPNRGEKLFMLATECARVLGYRDSYLLFNKNRSLYKIIANQAEKDNLIHQEILPYSYRSRQIAIVTARSMFRQFGSRLIEGGRRVRDDYWEAKARKQGFTEDDPAGEKRPGAARAREQAAAEAAASHANALNALPQGEIIYSNAGMEAGPPGLGQVSLAPLPMIHLPSEDLRPSASGGILRPRQEVIGPAYVDITRSSAPAEIMTQAVGAADFNKQLAAQRQHRSSYLTNYWERPHEQQTTEAQTEQAGASTVAPQNLQSPQSVAQQRQDIPQAYSAYQNQQNAMPSPVQTMHRGAPGQIHHGSPSMAVGAQHRQTPSYPGYPSNQMWPPPQPQPSPLGQSHMSGYGQQPQQQHHSQMPPPQMPGQNMSYAQQLGQMNSAYAGMNRSMYQPNPSQYMGAQTQSGPGQQPGMQGWSTPGNSMPQNYGYQ